MKVSSRSLALPPTNFVPKHRLRGALLLSVTLALAALSVDYADAGRLYKWVDENGRVHYGDKIPPEYAKRESRELNTQGVQVDKRDAAKTAEQIAEEERQRAEAAERARIQAERDAHDRMLLATFSTEDDMVMTRDGKIAAIDGAVRVTEGHIERINNTLSELTGEVADLERSGRPIPDQLRDSIVEQRRQLHHFQDFIVNKRKEQEAIRAQFGADIQRFRELQQERLLREHHAQQQPASESSGAN